MSEDASESSEPFSDQAQLRKARRRRQSILDGTAEGPGEEWMLTYMDTVTLLVSLFVMIMSFSSVDSEKYREFLDGMSLAKYGSGIMMGSLVAVEGVGENKLTNPKPIVMSSNSRPAPDVESLAQSGNFLTDLQDQISRQGLENEVLLREREGTVEMEINESVLFPAGRAQLSELGISVLVRLSRLLKLHVGTISVEGHTDNLPIKTDQFPSNWELSGSRASSVVRHLTSNGVEPGKLRIVGYADNRPLGTNESPDGRQRNRRVNIVLEFLTPTTSQ